MRSTFGLLVAVLMLISAFPSPLSATETGMVPEVPVQGMVTMVDLGAKKCIPCKMMAPILEKLEQEYEGRAAIVFIDVWRPENKPYIKRFGLRGIPTQIFFDKDGKEVFRHVGFLGKKQIEEMLRKLGVN